MVLFFCCYFCSPLQNTLKTLVRRNKRNAELEDADAEQPTGEVLEGELRGDEVRAVCTPSPPPSPHRPVLARSLVDPVRVVMGCGEPWCGAGDR